MSTTAKTAALGILAIAQHAVDHDLTADSIDAPTTHGEPLTIKVRSIHLDAWLGTLLVDDGPITRPVGEAKLYETVRYHARVPSPIGEVRVQLLAVRRIVAPLHLVPASGRGVAS